MSAITTLQLTASGMRFSALATGVGPVVLCVHGFPDHARSFIPLLGHLATVGFHTIAPTLRGYEPSSQPDNRRYDLFALAADVRDWIDHLGVERVHYVGHDWGAVIGYAVAMMYPQRLSSLCTIAVPLLDGPAALSTLPSQVLKSWYMAFFQLPTLSEALFRANDFALLEHLWRRWSPGWQPTDDSLRQIKTTFRAPGVTTAALSYYRALFNPRSTVIRQLQRRSIPVRTLAITGERDGCIDTRLFDRALPTHRFSSEIRVERITDAGHFAHLEQPEAVNTLLEEWLCTRTPQ